MPLRFGCAAVVFMALLFPNIRLIGVDLPRGSSLYRFGLPLLEAAVALVLVWRSRDLRDFLKDSLLKDLTALPGAFVLAMLAIFIHALASTFMPQYLCEPFAGKPIYLSPFLETQLPRWMFIAWLSTFVVLLEEVVFKVLVLHLIGLQRSKVLFIAGAVALFSLAHINQGPRVAIEVAVFVGIPSAVYFAFFRNLGATAAFHATWNVWAGSRLLF